MIFLRGFAYAFLVFAGATSLGLAMHFDYPVSVMFLLGAFGISLLGIVLINLDK